LADENSETTTLRSRIEALVTASQGAFTRMYQEAASQPGAGAGGEGSDDDVVEAEIVDEGDEQTT
jgi:hypothetical protein